MQQIITSAPQKKIHKVRDQEKKGQCEVVQDLDILSVLNAIASSQITNGFRAPLSYFLLATCSPAQNDELNRKNILRCICAQARVAIERLGCVLTVPWRSTFDLDVNISYFPCGALSWRRTGEIAPL
ncbi:hypothetical protein DBV23_17225 [Edwardsiella ictaluri]|nr:hypothetical protein DBV23_17225 [Edwardsiella ictaluri]KMQ73833.1 hypothetical protein ABY58_17000 [Edwardsiella ictaluri]KOO53961.1 hypothetical protein ACS33_17015 [Edwardsiella ictaluri]